MEDFYWYWLCNIQGIGNEKIRNILKVFRTPEEVYKANENLLKKINKLSDRDVGMLVESRKNADIYKEYVRLPSQNIKFTYPGKVDYPKKLLNIYDYPFGLYYKGKMVDFSQPSVAIIGARNCSAYGKNIAREFAYKFANMGIQVISGMAAGIDAAGHEGCLSGGGKTCAVLGCGVDICYPKSNIELYVNLERCGGILSEYALGTPPLAGQFPARNRIISGLADVVVVIEARKKSGSLITVDQALEQNKDIMVVPGRIGDALSEGCNNLIKLGAQIITKPEDILENNSIASFYIQQKVNQNGIDTGMFTKEKSGVYERGDEISLATEKNMVYSCLNLYPKNLDSIIIETGLDMAVIGKQLLELQLEGYIQEVSKNSYTRVHL